mmetsp:Transcript_10374/g.15703  ORF Transcript_10374/g.15703 Transcript_10374/m.15703 type:complete len:1075 (-) Transcript_10374:100-3324(-)
MKVESGNGDNLQLSYLSSSSEESSLDLNIDQSHHLNANDNDIDNNSQNTTNTEKIIDQSHHSNISTNSKKKNLVVTGKESNSNSNSRSHNNNNSKMSTVTETKTSPSSLKVSEENSHSVSSSAIETTNHTNSSAGYMADSDTDVEVDADGPSLDIDAGAGSGEKEESSSSTSLVSAGKPPLTPQTKTSDSSAASFSENSTSATGNDNVITDAEDSDNDRQNEGAGAEVVLQERVQSLEGQLSTLNATLQALLQSQQKQQQQYSYQQQQQSQQSSFGQFTFMNLQDGISLHDTTSNISVATIPEVDEPPSSSSEGEGEGELDNCEDEVDADVDVASLSSANNMHMAMGMIIDNMDSIDGGGAAVAVDLDLDTGVAGERGSDEAQTQTQSLSTPNEHKSILFPVKGGLSKVVSVPDLEYRSYTPNYEEELRKIRKMSIDQTDVNTSASSVKKVSSKNSLSDMILGGPFNHQMEETNKENEGIGAVNGSNNGIPPMHPNNSAKKETVGRSSSEEKSGSGLKTLVGTAVQDDIHAEGRRERDEDTQSVQSSKKGIFSLPLTTPDRILSSNIKPLISPLITAANNIRDAASTSSTAQKNKSVNQMTVSTASGEGHNVSSCANVNGNGVTTPRTRSKEELMREVEEKLNNNAIMSFIRGLNIDSRQQDGSATADVDANMEEFLKVPFRIENLLFFGLAICADSFVHVLTVTPLKFVWSLLCLICTAIRPGKGIGWCSFHRRHLYQLLRVFIIVFVYKFALCPISFGKVYHWIRGQAMLKLYVLMAMVEVFDRLMCSFGQDAMDSLYWNTTRRPYHPRMIASTLVALIYTIFHSLILFVHAATLNVAMNSADSALMSLLIGGNFAEIKSTVFKKYNKQNLFKITTSDICERFKLVLFLGLVLLLNCSQGGMSLAMVKAYIYQSCTIMAAELLCDWIKHSFITKFNFIKSSVYLDYSLVLAGDITGLGHDSMHMDQCHSVVKRLGFAQIPLVCVMLRYIKEAVRFADTLTNDGDSNHVMYSFAVVWTSGSWRMISLYMFSLFSCLVGIKFLLGWAITRTARSIILYDPVEKNDTAPKRRQAV